MPERDALAPSDLVVRGDAPVVLQHHGVGAARAVVGRGRGGPDGRARRDRARRRRADRRGETLMGVLSLTHRGGLRLDRERAARVAPAPGRPARRPCRSWSTCGARYGPQHAPGSGAARRRPAAAGRQRRAKGSARALCETALDVSAPVARRSSAGTRSDGELHLRHRRHGPPHAGALGQGRARRPKRAARASSQVLEDARGRRVGARALWGAASIREPGSVAIVPSPRRASPGGAGARGSGGGGLTLGGMRAASTVSARWSLARSSSSGSSRRWTGAREPMRSPGCKPAAFRRAARSGPSREADRYGSRCRWCWWTSITSRR